MSSGFISNFKDLGFSSGTIGNTGATSYTNVSNDLYIPLIQCGVYMLNTGSILSFVNPICCSSAVSFDNTSAVTAILLYPGWSAQLFTLANYTGTVSNIIINNTNNPVIYRTSTSFTTYYGVITVLGTSTTWTVNNTRSIKIWFRGTEIITSGLS
jgi:hypothetical protein